MRVDRTDRSKFNPNMKLIPRSEWQVPAFDISLMLGRRFDACIVIPVINEGERIRRLLDRMKTLAIGEAADIIIVDGGSSDGSLDLEFLREYSVRALLVKRGSGKLSAQLRCAYAFALDQGYQQIVTIDGNDKDDPEAIPRFIQSLREGVDFVQASRYVPGGVAENTPVIRDLAIRLLHAPLLSLSSGFKWTDTTQGFRAYRSAVLLDPRVAPFREVFSTYELLAYLSHRVPRLGYRCLELPTVRRYPKGEIPTKISAVRGNLAVLKVLLRSCTGRYDPAIE
jgi:dolichol-phosphate mannosyltransferase